MKNIILILAIMASTFSELDGSILRDTSNPPLIDKGSELTYAEFDGNFVKQYNAIQDIVSGANVEAYDAGATYDAYSTDVYEQYCGYDSRIWKATYNGSPSSFSGQTPAEGSYWTQVSLAQLLPNIMSLAELAYATNARRGMCAQYCTEWQAFTQQNIFTAPVDITGLPTPGAGKVIVLKYIMYALDAGGTAYDFGAMTAMKLAFSTTPSLPLATIAQAYTNSATDILRYYSIIDGGLALVANDKIVLTAGADATQGNGTYYLKFIYQIEDAPF